MDETTKNITVEDLQSATHNLVTTVHDVLGQVINIVQDILDTKVTYNVQTGTFTGTFNPGYYVAIGRDLNNFTVFVTVTEGDKTGIFEAAINMEGIFSAKRGNVIDKQLLPKFANIMSQLAEIEPDANIIEETTTENS